MQICFDTQIAEKIKSCSVTDKHPNKSGTPFPTMQHDHTFIFSEEVKKYKVRPLHGQRDTSIPTDSSNSSPVNETLVEKCLRSVAANFATRPHIENLPEKLLPKLVERLPLDLPVNVSAAHVHSESYWKKCCLQGRGWRNCQIAEHGLTWKQTFFELFIQQEIEAFDPNVHDIDDLHLKLEAAEDYVFNLKILQLLSHIDLQHIFSRLPNLSKLELTYGVKQVRMNFERSLFGMKISDADSLKQCIKATDVLTTLVLPSNLIDDDLLRQLMGGLINNSTITHLDFSHNKITNHGARLLAKLLGSRSVLTMLNLCDNQIHAEGGRYLGRALRRNESLIELNMRLNRLTDEGGRMLLEGLRDNGSLQLLNLSSNSLAAETTRSFASLLRNPYCALVAVDLSNNEIDDNDVATVQDVVRDNMSITSLDLRNNNVTKGNETLMSIASTIRANELQLRK